MDIPLPTPDEYREYQLDYINRVPAHSDVFALLSGQPARLRTLLSVVDDTRASAAPKAGEWSIKQVVGHMIDTERILSYRALAVSRGEKAPIPGFEQDDYEANSHSNARTLDSLFGEFELVRAATLPLYRNIAPGTYANIGTISGGPISVRTLLRIIPGHVEQHMASIKKDFGL
jgi:hypothetical protein